MNKIFFEETVSLPNGGYKNDNCFEAQNLNVQQILNEMQRGDFNGLYKLLNHGINPSQLLTNQGHTPLSLAVIYNDFISAEKLIKAGANVNYRYSKNGISPSTYLNLILKKNKPSLYQPLLEVFLNNNADPNLPLNENETLPLCFSVKNALVGPIMLLIKAGADPFKVDYKGKCAIQYALDLPDFQQALILKALFPKTMNTFLFERIVVFFEEKEDPLLNWLKEIWVDNSNQTL